MVAVEQKAALFAAAGSRRQQCCALVVRQAVQLFMEIRRVEQALGNTFDELGTRGAVVEEQSVGAGHTAQRPGRGFFKRLLQAHLGPGASRLASTRPEAHPTATKRRQPARTA